MIVDFDDFHEGQHRLDLLQRLHDANPLFRVTVFAVPAYCPDSFLTSLPDWVEVALHGWDHGGPACLEAREAEHWTYDQTIDVLLSAHPRFVQGWKSPGWQISDGTYEALTELGWWCADHPENDGRRPEGLRVHVYGDGDHWHGHVQDVCSNGLRETFPTLLARVTQATTFDLVSEVVTPWLAKTIA